MVHCALKFFVLRIALNFRFDTFESIPYSSCPQMIQKCWWWSCKKCLHATIWSYGFKKWKPLCKLWQYGFWSFQTGAHCLQFKLLVLMWVSCTQVCLLSCSLDSNSKSKFPQIVNSIGTKIPGPSILLPKESRGQSFRRHYPTHFDHLSWLVTLGHWGIELMTFHFWNWFLGPVSSRFDSKYVA